MYKQKKDYGKKRATLNYLKQYPYIVQQQVYDNNGWRNYQIARADKKQYLRLMKENKRTKFVRYRLINKI